MYDYPSATSPPAAVEGTDGVGQQQPLPLFSPTRPTNSTPQSSSFQQRTAGSVPLHREGRGRRKPPTTVVADGRVGISSNSQPLPINGSIEYWLPIRPSSPRHPHPHHQPTTTTMFVNNDGDIISDYVDLDILSLFLRLGAKEYYRPSLPTTATTSCEKRSLSPNTEDRHQVSESLLHQRRQSSSRLYITRGALLSPSACIRLGSDRSTIENVLTKNRILHHQQQQQDHNPATTVVDGAEGGSGGGEDDAVVVGEEVSGSSLTPAVDVGVGVVDSSIEAQHRNTGSLRPSSYHQQEPLIGLEEFATLLNEIEEATLAAREKLIRKQEKQERQRSDRRQLIEKGSDRSNRPRALEYVYGGAVIAGSTSTTPVPLPPPTRPAMRGQSPITQRGSSSPPSTLPITSSSPRHHRSGGNGNKTSSPTRTHHDDEPPITSAYAPVPPPTPAAYRPPFTAGRVHQSTPTNGFNYRHNDTITTGSSSSVVTTSARIYALHRDGERHSQHLPEVARSMQWIADEEAERMRGGTLSDGDDDDQSPRSQEGCSPADVEDPQDDLIHTTGGTEPRRPLTSPQRVGGPMRGVGGHFSHKLGKEGGLSGPLGHVHRNRLPLASTCPGPSVVRHVVAFSALQQLESLVGERTRAANPPPPPNPDTKPKKKKRRKGTSPSAKFNNKLAATAHQSSQQQRSADEEEEEDPKDPDALNPAFYEWVNSSITHPLSDGDQQHASPRATVGGDDDEGQQPQPRRYVYRQDRVRREDTRLAYNEALTLVCSDNGAASTHQPQQPNHIGINIYLPTLDVAAAEVGHLNKHLAKAAQKAYLEQEMECKATQQAWLRWPLGEDIDTNIPNSLSGSELSDVERTESASNQIASLKRFSSHHHTLAVSSVIAAFITGRLSEQLVKVRRVVKLVLQPVCRGYLRSRKSLAEFRTFRGGVMRSVGGAAIDAPMYAKQHRSPYAGEALLGKAYLRSSTTVASPPPPFLTGGSRRRAPPPDFAISSPLVYFVCIPTLLGYEYTFRTGTSETTFPLSSTSALTTAHHHHRSAPSTAAATTTTRQNSPPVTTRPQQYLNPRPPPTLWDVVNGRGGGGTDDTTTSSAATHSRRKSPNRGRAPASTSFSQKNNKHLAVERTTTSSSLTTTIVPTTTAGIANRYHKHQSLTYNRYTPITIAGQARSRDATARAKEDAAVSIYRFMKLAVAKWKLSKRRKLAVRCEHRRLCAESLLVLQSFARGRVGVDHSTERYNEKMRQESALTIQRVVRGRKGAEEGTSRRKAVAEGMRLREVGEERDAASTVLGAFWRRCLGERRKRRQQTAVEHEQLRREREETQTFVSDQMRIFTPIAKQVQLRRRRQREINVNIENRVQHERTSLAAIAIQRVARGRAGWLARASRTNTVNSLRDQHANEERLVDRATTIQEASRYTLSTQIITSLRQKRTLRAVSTLQRFYRRVLIKLRLLETTTMTTASGKDEGGPTAVRCQERQLVQKDIQERVINERLSGAREELEVHWLACISGREAWIRMIRNVVSIAISGALNGSEIATEEVGERVGATVQEAKPGGEERRHRPVQFNEAHKEGTSHSSTSLSYQPPSEETFLTSSANANATGFVIEQSETTTTTYISSSRHVSSSSNPGSTTTADHHPQQQQRRRSSQYSLTDEEETSRHLVSGIVHDAVESALTNRRHQWEMTA